MRLRPSNGTRRPVAAVLRQDQPARDVEDEPCAAEEGEDHEGDPQDQRVDVEVAGQAAGDAGDVAVTGATADPPQVTDVVPADARTGVGPGRRGLLGLRRCRAHGDNGAPSTRRTPSGRPLIRAGSSGVGARVGVRGRPGLLLVVRAVLLCDDGVTMTASLPAHDAPRELARDVRRARRDTQHPIIGGVAAGLASHLAVPVVWVRAAFLVSGVLGGIGILFYAGLWLVLPAESPFESGAPGLESASRQGRRPGRIRRLADSGPAIALVALGLGLVLTAEAIFGNGVVIWAARPRRRRLRPAVAPGRRGAAGTLARPVRAAQPGPGRLRHRRLGVVPPGRRGRRARRRLGRAVRRPRRTCRRRLHRAGRGRPRRHRAGHHARPVGLAADHRPRAERAERVRTQERADLAAHLHDSVLQTLALIQKNAGDAGDGDPAGPVAGARPALVAVRRDAGRRRHPDRRRCARVVGEIEDTYGVDGRAGHRRRRRPSTTTWARSSRRPARRATNAAKHAGTPGRRHLRRGRRRAGRGLRPRPRRRLRPRARSPPTGTAYATASSTG